MTQFTPFFEDDPLLLAAGTERLRPVDGVLLTSDHLKTEQLYHRARLARILAYLQGPGTVAGLDVLYTPKSGGGIEVQVTPGLAIDYRGRLLELDHLACLSLGDWMAERVALRDPRLIAGRRGAGAGWPDHLVVDLFAEFAAFARRPEPAFATGSADYIDAIAPSLSHDAVHLQMMIRQAMDNRLPESMISRLVPGAANLARVQEAKRKGLWRAMAPRPDGLAPASDQPATEHDLTAQDFGGVFLARLHVPLRAGPGGGFVFDDSFDMTAATAGPRFDGRLYSYSNAEIQLLAGHRR